MEHEFVVDGQAQSVTLQAEGSRIRATVGGRNVEADGLQVSPNIFSLLVDGRSYHVRLARQGEKILAMVGASHFCLRAPDRGRDSDFLMDLGPGKKDGVIKAPMPGLVIKVNVVEGSEVQPGDGLVVVEAMKMEHEMRAGFAAVVDKVYVGAGEQVDAFQPLLELKPVEEQS